MRKRVSGSFDECDVAQIARAAVDLHRAGQTSLHPVDPQTALAPDSTFYMLFSDLRLIACLRDLSPNALVEATKAMGLTTHNFKSVHRAQKVVLFNALRSTPRRKKARRL